MLIRRLTSTGDGRIEGHALRPGGHSGLEFNNGNSA